MVERSHMPLTRIHIPFSAPAHVVCLAYLAGYGGINDCSTVLSYLQRVRSHPLRASLATYEQRYLDELPRAVRECKSLLKEYSFDAALRLPSSRGDAAPYLEALLEDRSTTKDVTSGLSRNAGAPRAGDGASLKEIQSGMSLKCRQLGDFKTVLIVDDILADGKSAAACINLLHENGLPQSAKITVFVPLRVRSSDIDLTGVI